MYSNVPLNKPRLCIDGEFYDGVFLSDKQHARFEIPKIKRKGIYSADVYDGDKNMSVSLEFRAQKQTREVDLFQRGGKLNERLTIRRDGRKTKRQL